MLGSGPGATMTSMGKTGEDRVLDWQEELRRIEGRLADLPPAARLAVESVIERFRAEDAARGQAA